MVTSQKSGTDDGAGVPVASDSHPSCPELVAELMALVNEALVAARRDAQLRQTKLLPIALARVAGKALSIAQDAELFQHLVENDPRFGMPLAWMRYPTLRDAVRSDLNGLSGAATLKAG